MTGGGSLSDRAISARASRPAPIEEGGGFRLSFHAGEYVLERYRDGVWLLERRGRWLFDVLGVAFVDGKRVEGPAAVALAWSSWSLDADARRWRGERRPASWSRP